jgi:hypothetical protein
MTRPDRLWVFVHLAAAVCCAAGCTDEQAEHHTSQSSRFSAQQSATSAQGACRWLLEADVDLKPVERARRLVTTGEVSTVDAFWESLYESSVVLMVHSKSTQWASPKYPRIIKVMKTSGRNGPRLPRQLFSAAIQAKAPPFDDMPASMNERGSRDTVELQWFECGALGPQWRFAFVQADEATGQLTWQGDEPTVWAAKVATTHAGARAPYRPSAHDHDPAVQTRCAGCHGQDMLHPNFHDYPMWPGAIGSLGLDIAQGHRSDRELFSEMAEREWLARWLQAYRAPSGASAMHPRMRGVLERLDPKRQIDSTEALEQLRIDNDEYTSDLYSLQTLVVTAQLLRWLEQHADATTRVRNGLVLYTALKPEYAIPLGHPPKAMTPTGPPGDRHIFGQLARATGDERFAASDAPARYRSFASAYYDQAQRGIQERVREHVLLSTALHSYNQNASSTQTPHEVDDAVAEEERAILEFYPNKEGTQQSVANAALGLFALRTLSNTDSGVLGTRHDPLLERDWYPVLQPVGSTLHFDLNVTSDPYTADFRSISVVLEEWFKLHPNRRAASCFQRPR